jgi:Fur family transcriptional regulator, peroxide stress response regulator
MTTTTRNTKYSEAIIDYINSVGHATNSELLVYLRKSFPELSATTVHRVTARLTENGVLAHAPKDSHGNLRYDANTSPHHHFYCSCCEKLQDVVLSSSLLSELEQLLGDCKLNGQLLINGACDKCYLENSKGK